MIRGIAPLVVVVEDAGVRDAGARLDEHVVALRAAAPAGELVERAGRVRLRVPGTERVDQPHGRLRVLALEVEDRRVVLAGVEVAGDDDRIARLARGDAFGEQLRAAHARRLRLVIEMGVEHLERPARSGLDEASPGDDARDLVAPALRARHVRRVRQPERAAVDDTPAIGPVQDRRVFAAFGAVLAPDADLAVARHRLADRVDLEAQRFLQADEIAALAADDVDHELRALRPRVRTVGRGAVADVERQHAYLELGCRCRRRPLARAGGEQQHEHAGREAPHGRGNSRSRRRYMSNAARLAWLGSVVRSAVSSTVCPPVPISPSPSSAIATRPAVNEMSAAPASAGSTAVTGPKPRSRLASSYSASMRRLPSVGASGG